LVVDQPGVIYSLNTDDGSVASVPFLNITDRVVPLNGGYDERGLLGLALHPDFASNGRAFAYYSAPSAAGTTFDHTDVLAEFSVDLGTGIADASSERRLLTVSHPQANHNGGDISFGPDGMLYVPIGDGGNQADTGFGHTVGIGNAQDLTTLLGKVLRIDVSDPDQTYSIPSDNPFASAGGNTRPEIWAWGFRNPAYATWDSGSSMLFVADAGQDHWEEVDIVEGGKNFGWNILEGWHCFDPAFPSSNPTLCNHTGIGGEDLSPPIIEFNHQIGVVVIGGSVYRGTAIPSLIGTYLYGVFSQENKPGTGLVLLALPPDPNASNPSATPADTRTVGGALTPTGAMWSPEGLTVLDSTKVPLTDLGAYLLGFGVDCEGEMYVLTASEAGPKGNTGMVLKAVAADPQVPVASSP
jgi:glucose/arabinose dehydrogenase